MWKKYVCDWQEIEVYKHRCVHYTSNIRKFSWIEKSWYDCLKDQFFNCGCWGKNIRIYNNYREYN